MAEVSRSQQQLWGGGCCKIGCHIGAEDPQQQPCQPSSCAQTCRTLSTKKTVSSSPNIIHLKFSGPAALAAMKGAMAALKSPGWGPTVRLDFFISRNWRQTSRYSIVLACKRESLAYQCCTQAADCPSVRVDQVCGHAADARASVHSNVLTQRRSLSGLEGLGSLVQCCGLQADPSRV